jgi:hypothetical protein
VVVVALEALGKMAVLTMVTVGPLRRHQLQGRLFITLAAVVLVVVVVQQALEAVQRQQRTRVVAEMDRPPALVHQRSQIQEAVEVEALMLITAVQAAPA